MSEKTATRQQLEDSVRALLPRTSDVPDAIRTATSSTAGVGLSALVTGFVMGWKRGRRSRRRK
jgi:hypothetical protein